MPISVIDNFQVNKLGPIDTRIIATSSAGRNAIVYKYDGLKVFQTDNRITYTWNASASNWDADTGLSNPVIGTGSSGFVPRWTSGSNIADSFIYTSQIALLSGLPVGRVGINTPPIGSIGLRETFQVNANYTGGEAPPFVISKGGTTVVGENWYFDGSEQPFVSSRGSAILQFDNNNLSIRTRAASSPSTTWTKLRITANDLELSSYEGQTPPTGTVMASIVARSLYYINNLSAIKFLADGSWSGGSYPTNITFFTVPTTSQLRAMTIKPNGNVIIGATSGSVGEKLLVEGDVRVQNVINFGAYSTPTFNRTGYIWAAPNFLQINRQTAHPINFATNNIDRVTIASDGKVGIGTGTNALSGSATLFISNGVNNNNLEISTHISTAIGCTFSGTVIQTINRTTEADRPDLNFLISNNVGAHKFFNGTPSEGTKESLRIGPNGRLWLWRVANGTTGLTNLTINATTKEVFVGGTSARKLKKDITNLKYGLSEVLSLNPVDFNWKSDSKKDIGFIADEVHRVIPEVVVLADNSQLDTGLENGEPMAINYEKLTAVLVKAMQEQQVQIDELKKEIENLKKS